MRKDETGKKTVDPKEQSDEGNGQDARMSLEDRLTEVDLEAMGAFSFVHMHGDELNDLVRGLTSILQRDSTNTKYVNPRRSFARSLRRDGRSNVGLPALEQGMKSVEEMALLWENEYSISAETLAVNAILWKVLEDAQIRDMVFSSLRATFKRWESEFEIPRMCLRQ